MKPRRTPLKRTRLERHTPLRQGKPLKRTELKRTGSQLKSGTPKVKPNGPVKPRSESTHIPEAIRLAVLDRDSYACQRCGVSLYGIRYGLQHRRPRGRGGSTLLHTMANLVSLCGWVGDAGTCTHDVEVTDRLRATAEGWLLPHRFRLISPEEWPVLRHGRWQQSGDVWLPADPHPRQLELLGAA